MYLRPHLIPVFVICCAICQAGCSRSNWKSEDLSVHVEALKREYRTRDIIHIAITVKNTSNRPLRVPRRIEEHVLLRGIDLNGKEMGFADMVPAEFEGSLAETVLLAPRESHTVQGPGTSFMKPGRYKLGGLFWGPKSTAIKAMWSGTVNSNMADIKVRE